MTGSFHAEQPIVAFALVLVAQCTVVSGLALLLAVLRPGAAYRATVLQIGLYCALSCPVVTAGLIAADIHGITIRIPESKSSKSRENAPAEARFNPLPEFRPPSQSPAQPIVDAARTGFAEPESKPAPILSTKRSFAAEKIPQATASESNPVPGGMLSAVVLWATGFFSGLIGIARGSLKLRGILRAAQPIDDDRIQPALQQVESTLSANKPLRVVESSRVNSPVAAGIGRSAIVLPQGLLEQVSPDELRAILLHEGAHVIRGDHLTLLLERLLTAAFWFHPLVHVLTRRLDRAREEVCDNYVLQSIDAPSYGEALLRLMRLSSDGTQAALAAGLFPTRWRLDERISGLLNEGRNTMITTKKAGKIFVTITLTLCAMAVGTARVTAQPETTPSDRDLTPKPAQPTLSTVAHKSEIPEATDTVADETTISTDEDPLDEDPLVVPERASRTNARPVPDRYLDDPRFRVQNNPIYTDSARPRTIPESGTTLQLAANRRGRIASVDMSRLIKSSTKFQRRSKALKQSIEADDQLQRQLKEQKSLRVALAAIPKDNEEARTALQKVIENKEAEIQQSKKEAFAAAKQEESQIYLDIYREACDAIQKYADYYKIELVLQMEGMTRTRTDHPVDAEPEHPGVETTDTEDVLRQINRPVIYASGLNQDIDDITDVIIEYLNKRDQQRVEPGNVKGDATF